MNRHRENEQALDAIWNAFRAEVLDRIDQKPNGYFDASFAIAVLGGRVVLQQATYDQDGFRITEKHKS
jgi:hypothetical protein